MTHALITGGGGFLGLAILKQLKQRYPDWKLSSLSRKDYPELKKLDVHCIKADLSQISVHELAQKIKGVDVVFHVAAKAGVWGSYESYHAINVTGTQSLLEASKATGVQYFIYTSSPSAVWNGNDEENLTEQDCPYPESYLTHYPKTKALAEKMVLKANDTSFFTTALRPHLIWGPGDPHLVPRLLQRRKKLKIIGSGQNKVGLTYVENAAWAHILAHQELTRGQEAKNAGKAYFITDEQPVFIWSWVNTLFKDLHLSTVDTRIPTQIAWLAGNVLEYIWKIFNLSDEPPMTRFVAKQLSCHHHYNLTAARQDFGYSEKISPQEGWNLLIEYYTDWLEKYPELK